MAQASIDGRPAALATAVAEAAALLAASRCALVAGLGTDIAGARAAIALAKRLGAVVDHMNASALLRDLDVARGGGVMLTTPNEARLRGDLLLLVGSGLLDAWPELPERLLEPAAPDKRRARIIWLCPGREAKELSAGGFEIASLGRNAAELPLLLAALRARIGGRPVRQGSVPARQLDRVAADLKAARFGVAVWSAATLDALTIEMLCGIVKDLNAATRFSGLALAPGDNAIGVLQACGWLTGFPMRTGFGRGYGEHDPWRFDARRLVDSGEADCVLWISAYRPAAPAWERDVPTIALTGAAPFRRAPRVHIAVGRPGVDHDGVEHLARTGTLAAVTASAESEAISVARVVADIAAALSVARPC
jgi:formylmethanofuran dehydrogenase subunit B